MKESGGGGAAAAAMGDVVHRSYILAYKEDVSSLLGVLSRERLNPTVLRASYTAEQEAFVRNTRTFMNHYSAWQKASEESGYTLICESDFVPCKDLRSRPVFWPRGEEKAWGYLYVGSPRLIALIGERRYLQAHCAPLVAYIVNAAVARALCRFFESEMARRDPRVYFAFDALLQWAAMGMGCQAFIPHMNYGEHGGKANPEHGAHGVRRAGRHRADNLIGSLEFLPQYCDGSRLIYLLTRLHARLLGLLRLAGGKWIVVTNVYRLSRRDRLHMNWIGLRRLLRH